MIDQEDVGLGAPDVFGRRWYASYESMDSEGGGNDSGGLLGWGRGVVGLAVQQES